MKTGVIPKPRVFPVGGEGSPQGRLKGDPSLRLKSGSAQDDAKWAGATRFSRENTEEHEHGYFVANSLRWRL
jgi:hypothetical protein